MVARPGRAAPPRAWQRKPPDMARAGELLKHDPFVFDVQTHISFDEIRPWPERNPPDRMVDFLKRIFVQIRTLATRCSMAARNRRPSSFVRTPRSRRVQRGGVPRRN